MKRSQFARKMRLLPVGPALLSLLTLVALGCSESNDQTPKQMPGDGTMPPDDGAKPPDDGMKPPDDGGRPPAEPGAMGPFKSVEAVANAPSKFSSPRSGVPLAGGGVAFIATLEDRDEEETTEVGERVAILMQAENGEPSALYAGDALSNPLDLALSLDGKTLYIADPAAGEDGQGALLTLSVAGGEPSVAVNGKQPRAVTVGPDDAVYFSGIDDESAEPAVFMLNGNDSTAVFSGTPLVDPSGIAAQKDGTLLVADTRLFDADPSLMSEAGIVRISEGTATILASGFATGYPAGIALTLDEKVLIVSGEGPDRSDTVYLVDMSDPSAPAHAVTASFSAFQDSSAGLKRAHDSNTFVWASLAAEGGTVFRIEAN